MTTRHLPLWVDRAVSQTRVDRTRLEGQLVRERGALPPVSCTKGCDNCCHYPTHITVLEGMTLYRDLVAQGQWGSLRPGVVDHWQKVRGLTLPVWFLAAIPCPLLRQGQCRAYQARPLVCRATVSRGDPADCHPHRGKLPERPADLDTFVEHQSQLLRAQGIHSMMVPLSLALLMAEKVEEGVLDLGDVDSAMRTAYRQKP